MNDPDYISPFDPELADECSDTFRRFIQQGLDAIERGDVVSHEEMMRWLERRIEARKRAPGEIGLTGV